MRDRGEGSIFQRKDGMWIGRVELPPGPGEIPERRRAQVARKKKSDVVLALKQLRADLERNGDLATSSQSLDSWVQWWLESVKSQQVRPRTLETYKGQAKWITNSIGHVSLRKLSTSHVDQLHEYMERQSKGKVTSKYRREVHAMLSAALQDAMKRGRVSRNVAALVDLPEKNLARLEALSVKEAVDVLGVCVPALKATPYDQAPIIWAAFLLTGMRRGELLGLEWDRVGESIDVAWQLQFIRDIDTAPPNFEYRNVEGKLYLVRPKTKAGFRQIPLVEPLRSLLAAHRERMGHPVDGLVFARPGGRPFKPSDVSAAWAGWREAVTKKDVRLHDLRHTTVDLLYEAGVPEDVIVEIVGHSQISMSRKYKARGNQKRLSEAMNSLSTLLGVEKLES